MKHIHRIRLKSRESIKRIHFSFENHLLRRILANANVWVNFASDQNNMNIQMDVNLK